MPGPIGNTIGIVGGINYRTGSGEREYCKSCGSCCCGLTALGSFCSSK